MGIYSQFVDINDKLYTVEFEGDNINGTKEITLGATPFVTNMDSNNDTLYSPIKAQGATITLVSDGYPFELYSSTAKGIKVVLYSGTESNPRANKEWIGYVTPSMFDMGFVTYLEEIEIECVDGLGILKNILYDATERHVMTFASIIQKILQQSNCFKYLYVSDNIQFNKTIDSTILDKIEVSEQNFFGKKDKGETDKDVSWSCYDVLYEICQFLGLTITADGENVYMLDYDAIKHQRNSYYRYDITTMACTKTTLQYNHKIDGTDYCDSTSTISLDNVYKKVSVKAEWNEFDSVFPDIWSNIENITESDPSIESSFSQTKNEWMAFLYPDEDDDSPNNNTLCFLSLGANNKVDCVGIKYYNNPSCTFYKYNASKANITNNSKFNELNYTETTDIRGAVLAKVALVNTDKTWNNIQVDLAQYIGKPVNYNQRFNYFNSLIKGADVNKLSFSNYILMFNPTAPTSGHIGSNEFQNYPFVETNTTETTSTFGGKNNYLVISGKWVYYVYLDRLKYPWQYDGLNLKEGRYCFNDDRMSFYCRLSWGDKYWNGSEWQDTPCDFSIRWFKKGKDRSERRTDATMAKEWEIEDTSQWYQNISQSGYVIDCTKVKLSGTPHFTIYCPKDASFYSTKGTHSQKGEHYKYTMVALKDFDIKAEITDPSLTNDGDNETIYTNVIDETYANTLDDITFKVNTNDNKKPSYSVVTISDGSTETDKLFNRSCQQGENAWDRWDSESLENGMRQEEHLVYKLSNQYSTPNAIMEIPLKDKFPMYALLTDTTLSNRDFIIDSQEFDYRYNKQTLKIIEKK